MNLRCLGSTPGLLTMAYVPMLLNLECKRRRLPQVKYPQSNVCVYYMYIYIHAHAWVLNANWGIPYHEFALSHDY